MSGSNSGGTGGSLTPGGQINMGGKIVTTKDEDVGEAATGIFHSQEGYKITVVSGIVIGIN